MKKVLNISHTDMDGYTCTLLLKHRFSNVENINISYNKTTETLEYLQGELNYSRPKLVIVSDLNFSKDDSLLLYKLVSTYKDIKFIYIDHHDYSDDEMKIFLKMKEKDNCTVIIDTTRSASKITYDVFTNKNDTNIKNINIFVDIVNAYDIWLKDTKAHKIGIDLNNYFWDIKGKRFLYEFKDFSLKNPKFLTRVKTIKDNSKKHFKMLEDKGLSFRDKGIRVLFTDDYLGSISSIYNEDFYIIATSYGRFSVRLDNISDELANTIKTKVVETVQNSPLFISGGGHNKAFGLTFNDTVKNNYDVIFDIMKTVFKVIDKELEDIPF